MPERETPTSLTRTIRPAVIAIALAGMLLTAGLAGAQTIPGQAEALAERAEDHADDAEDDPQAFAGNATDASWRAREVNRTLAWTCDTARAVDEDAGELARELTDCPEAESASAGEEDDEQPEEANETRAEAERLENDTRTAVEDEAAAAEAFVDDVRTDPENADEHARTFLERTIQILQRLLGAPAERIEQTVEDAQQVVADAVSTVEDLLEETKDLLHGLLNGSIEGLPSGVDLVGDGVLAVADAVTSATTATVHGVTEAATGAADTIEAGVTMVGETVDAGIDALTKLVRGDRPSSEPATEPIPEQPSQAVDTDRLPVELPVETPRR